MEKSDSTAGTLLGRRNLAVLEMVTSKWIVGPLLIMTSHQVEHVLVIEVFTFCWLNSIVNILPFFCQIYLAMI